MSIWWTTGWTNIYNVIGEPITDPADVSRLIGGTQWLAYGFVVLVAWPGLVHDSSVSRTIKR